MSLESCKSSLKEYINTQGTNSYLPLSVMTSKVWWDQKNQCVGEFGGFAHVKEFVETYSIDQWSLIHASADQDSVEQAVVMPAKPQSFFQYIKDQINWWKSTNNDTKKIQTHTWVSSSDGMTNNSNKAKTINTVQWTVGVSNAHWYSKDNLMNIWWNILYVLLWLFVLYLIMRSMRIILQLIYDFFFVFFLVYLNVIQLWGYF